MTTDRDISLIRAALEAAARVADKHWLDTSYHAAAEIRALDPAAIAAGVPHKIDVLDRLSGYNPPDRTIDEQRQMAQDIHDAATEIERLRARVAELEENLESICVKCRSNEWGPDTPRKEILNWMHDKAASALDTTVAAAMRKG